MTDRYAVFGNPIAHSKSPDIHGRFAVQTGQDLTYDRQCVAVDGFAAAADQFFASGGKGLNITVPFKQDAFGYAAELTARARRAGAVNTLAYQSNGRILGDNTDGAGLVRDIRANLGWEIGGKRLLILGAGGAVRGVLAPLLAQEPHLLFIANRTKAKALALADEFADLGPIVGGGYDALSGQAFDLVINGTSASLAGDLPPLPEQLLAPKACCYDMMYGKDDTPFMAWSRYRGGAVADGLGMLVEQAAESFQLWRGVFPHTAAVIEALRRQLG